MKVTKKNGKVVLFDDEKVVRSILKANAEVPNEAMMRKTAQRYANEVFDRLTERSESGEIGSKRKEVKELIADMRKNAPNIEYSIFHSIHDVCLDTMAGYRWRGKKHSFLEHYDSGAHTCPCEEE